MPPFTVQDIVRATQGALVTGDLAVPVSGVSIDSRTLGVGEAYVAIRGHRLDGHSFLADAASRGASCLVVHSLHDDTPASVPLVLVEDTTRSLGLLAASHRARFSLPVVAVTSYYEDYPRARAKDFAAYFQKPLAIDEFCRAVADLVPPRRARL